VAGQGVVRARGALISEGPHASAPCRASSVSDASLSAATMPV
jgi:hypothetical protein